MAAREHPAFPPPPDRNVRIWRYIDLPKLVSFLMGRGELHLSPLTAFDDEFEGRLPAHAIQSTNAEYAQMERIAGRDPGTDPRYAEAMVEWLRATVLVNCWCRSPHESEALWRLYNYPSGVAITTTFAKLANALPVQCSIGCVRYIDYATEAPPTDNAFRLAAHKRSFFSHEQEVRVVHAAYEVHRTVYPEKPPSAPPFMTFPVAFSAYEGIVLSPYAPSWFLPLVQDLVRRYECTIPVSPSEMIVDLS